MEKYICVVAYFDINEECNLRQSIHIGETKGDAMRDFFKTHTGQKGANVLWLDLDGLLKNELL